MPATPPSDFRDDAGRPVYPTTRAERQEQDQRYHRRRERSRMRRDAAQADQPVDWLREDGGTPLGHGFPSGAPLRADGESHSDAWRRILREDPCAYCDAPLSGTVDHVVPRSQRTPGLERWPNLVGACETCNGAKGAKSLLAFLLLRKVNVQARVAA